MGVGRESTNRRSGGSATTITEILIDIASLGCVVLRRRVSIPLLRVHEATDDEKVSYRWCESSE